MTFPTNMSSPQNFQAFSSPNTTWGPQMNSGFTNMQSMVDVPQDIDWVIFPQIQAHVLSISNAV